MRSKVTPVTALSVLPDSLKDSLVSEYCDIEQNYLERRWSSAELSGGRFAEVVFSIIEGCAKGSYPSSASKPGNFLQACRNLENQTSLPRSFRILIPRMLPALYEVRNNRNVGHVGGEIDPDYMDSTVVISMCSWILAEMVRVLHDVSTDDAQRVVDGIVDFKTGLIWKNGAIRRVLDPKMPYRDQVLVLLASSGGSSTVEELYTWTEHKALGNFNKILKRLHEKRLIELDQRKGVVELLPPGKEAAAAVLQD